MEKGILKTVWKYGYDNRKYLIFAFATGLLAHMVKITNYYPTWDSMYAMDLSMDTMLLLGRWLAGAAAIVFSSSYDLQWVEGIMALAFWSAIIVLILDIFEIKKGSYKLLSIVLFMVFPSMASVFCYMNWAAAYAFSFFLAILAVFVSIKGTRKKDIIFCSTCICCSMGIYQIYMTTATVCFFYFLIIQLMKKDVDSRRIKNSSIRFVFSVIFGACIYLITNKAILQITGNVLSDYQGVASVGKMSGGDFVHAFIRLAKSGISFYFDRNSMGIYNVINLLFLLSAVFIWGYYVLINNVYSLKRRLLIFIFLCVIVCSTYGFLFASVGTTYHMIMQIGNYFSYLGIIILLECKISSKKYLKMLMTGLLCFLCFYHFINNNIAYKQMEMSYEKTCFETIGVLNKIDGINTDGIKEVAIIGQFKNGEKKQLLKVIPSITGASENNFLYSPFHFVMFTQYYFNRTFVEADEVKLEKIKKTEEFQKMPVYPYSGSVQIIDSTIVVKLEELIK